jgi:hypothetical protein
MDTLWEREGMKSEDMQAWVVRRASGICAMELNRLTHQARRGPFHEDMKLLCMSPVDVSVKMLNEFSIGDLTDMYVRITPHLQSFLATVIGKTTPAHQASLRELWSMQT